MGLYDQIAADLAEIHADTYGPAIIVTPYNASGVAQTPVKAQFDRFARTEPAFDDGAVETRIGVLIITLAELPSVALDWSFSIPTVDGTSNETWKVSAIDKETPAWREIAVMRTDGRRWATGSTEHDRERTERGGRAG